MSYEWRKIDDRTSKNTTKRNGTRTSEPYVSGALASFDGDHDAFKSSIKCNIENRLTKLVAMITLGTRIDVISSIEF